MLRTVGPVRHVIVGAFVVGLGTLAAIGVIGAGDQALTRPEHFDAKFIEVSSAGPDRPDGVRIRETVDIDFGLAERRGYQRIIPHDFGAPVDVAASSPDANGEVEVADFGGESRIRIGNRNIDYTGQRRYVLDYTLPDAQLGGGELNLDIIGHDETFVTDRFTVVISGFEFTDTSCDLGERGAFGGCELQRRADGSYITVIERLMPGQGITVGGSFTDRTAAPASANPPVPDRNPSGLRPFGIVVMVIGAITAVIGYFRLRAKGSNEVFGAGGAADAAFGELGLPGTGAPVADVATYRVPDNRLAELATIEFVPPRGLEPWHGRVLLTERVDDGAVSAWFAEMVAREAVILDESDGTATLRRGTGDPRLSAVDQALLTELFSRGASVDLGRYDSAFAKVWSSIAQQQRQVVGDSGWWDPPIDAPPNAKNLVFGTVALLALVGLVVVNSGSEAARGVLGGVFGRQPGAVLLTILVMMLVSGMAYAGLRASRTAVGSALTLRTESFRRFLIASEGRHVDWAWEHGLIREYSAWAVALDAADAWSDAIQASSVPDETFAIGSPLAVHTMSQSFASAHTAPSSSSSGGGGGGSGGGGGGGSSGSW